MEDTDGYSPRLGPETSKSALALSPTRKAILDRFQNINMGPPPAIPSSSAVLAASRGQGTAANSNPFKRALINSKWGNLAVNTAHHSGSSPSARKPHVDSPASADISVSLVNMSQRLANSSILEYDILAAADDSLLIEAKKLGDESFDQRLVLDRSPLRDRRPLEAKERISSPERLRTADSGPQLPPGGDRPSIELGAPSIFRGPKLKKMGSFSSNSDTSNLLDEQGEQSLLFATIKLKKIPGRSVPPDQARLLASLAEDNHGYEEGAVVAATHAEHCNAITLGLEKRSGSIQESTAKTAAKPCSQVNLSPRRAAPSSSRPSTAPRLGIRPASSRVTGGRCGAGIASSRGIASLRDRDVTTDPLISRTTQSVRLSQSLASAGIAGTPRSRPPLYASAAQMRRISALPQPKSEVTVPQTPQRVEHVGRLGSSTAVPTTAPRLKTTATEAASSAGITPARNVVRPSLTDKFAPSSPRTFTAMRTPAVASVLNCRSQSQGVTRTTAQPERRSMTSSRGGAGPTTATALRMDSAPTSAARRPTPPFLLESGIKNTVHSKSPSLDGDLPLPGSSSPFKPMASTSAIRLGSSTSQLSRTGVDRDGAALSDSSRIARKSLAASMTAMTTARTDRMTAASVRTSALPRPSFGPTALR